MHEWALVDAVLCAASSAAKENGLRTVDEVVAVLGELQAIDGKAFSSIFSDLRENYAPVFSKASLVLEIAPAVLSCKACGKDFSFAEGRAALKHEEKEAVHFVPDLARVFIKCPFCKSPDFTIKQGRGVYLKEIRGGK